MNVFGAFTFGSLIKTFLPGLVWLIALILVEDDLASVTPVVPHMQASALLGQAQNLLVLAFPAAILLGLVSNIIVFMGINDKLVRNPFKNSDKKIDDLYKALCKRMLTERWRLLGWDDSQQEATFREHVDSELLVLQTLGVPNLAYVREQYWYHLEFQVNLLFACLGLLIATLCSQHVYGLPAHDAVIRGLLSAGVLGSLCLLLLSAARKNYRRHMAKMCSLIAAVLCAELKEQAAEAADDPQPKTRLGVDARPIWAVVGLIAGIALVTRRGLSGRDV